MPFFQCMFYPKYKGKDRMSLQVQRLFKSVVYQKRAFLFASRKLGAALTVEAALVTSIFLYASFAIIHFMLMFQFDAKLQMCLNNVARECSKKMYYLQIIEKVECSKNDGEENKKNKEKIQQYYEGKEESEDAIVEKALDTTYLYSKIGKEIGFDIMAKKLVDLSKSYFDMEQGMADLVAIYHYRYPFFTKDNDINIVRRAKMKAWTGEDMTKEQKLVYITRNGKVYHTNKMCRYLSVDVIKTTYQEMKGMHNAQGRTYSTCNKCGESGKSETRVVYLTQGGENYHEDIDCSGLKRSIITVDFSQVQTWEKCSVCEGQ